MSQYGPFELCEWLRSSIEADLLACGSEPVTTTYSGVGLIAWDDCCGQLVVAPERIFRSVDFPAEDTTDERCYAGSIAVTLLASLVRCVPSPDDRGNAPKPAALAAAHKAILDDAAIVWQSMNGAIDPEWDRAGLSQTFVGNQGGCVAIESRVTIGVEATNWCATC
jgi:hypothetical protein